MNVCPGRHENTSRTEVHNLSNIILCAFLWNENELTNLDSFWLFCSISCFLLKMMTLQTTRLLKWLFLTNSDLAVFHFYFASNLLEFFFGWCFQNADETDGVPNRVAMTVEERRRHFRKMQSMGSLCNTPVMFSLTNQVTSVAQALKAVKVRMAKVCCSF